MTAPAPVKVLQHKEHQEKRLHNKVADYSTQAGYPVTAAQVDPDDNSPLKGIEEAMEDTVHVVGSTFDEQVGGAGETARIRTAQGNAPMVIAAARRLKQKLVSMKKAV